MTVHHWRPSSSGAGSISITQGSALLTETRVPTLASTQRSTSSKNGDVPCWAFFLAHLHAVVDRREAQGGSGKWSGEGGHTLREQDNRNSQMRGRQVTWQGQGRAVRRAGRRARSVEGGM